MTVDEERVLTRDRGFLPSRASREQCFALSVVVLEVVVGGPCRLISRSHVPRVRDVLEAFIVRRSINTEVFC